MGKIFAYLGGLLGILGTSLILLGYAFWGSPALAVALAFFLSGWFGNFRREREDKPEPKKKSPHRSAFDL